MAANRAIENGKAKAQSSSAIDWAFGYPL